MLAKGDWMNGLETIYSRPRESFFCCCEYYYSQKIYDQRDQCHFISRKLGQYTVIPLPEFASGLGRERLVLCFWDQTSASLPYFASTLFHVQQHPYHLTGCRTGWISHFSKGHISPQRPASILSHEYEKNNWPRVIASLAKPENFASRRQSSAPINQGKKGHSASSWAAMRLS